MSDFFDRVPETDASAATAFAANRIERRSEHRSADTLSEAKSAPDARFYLFRGNDVLTRGEDPLFTAAEANDFGAEDATVAVLGWADGAPRLAATIAADAPVDESRITLTDLRALAVAGSVSPEHLGALAQGRSLTNWHARHGFCSNCGTPTVSVNGGLRRDCPTCETQHFPRTDPVVIMAVTDGERLLLGRQLRFAEGMYSCLAGFMEPGETIEDAVRRETLEESGIHTGRVRYYASQPWPFPASLMIGCHAEAISTDIKRDETELDDCRWFDRDEVATMVAGTHPQGLKTPFAMAIASHLIRAWADGG